MEKYLRVYDVKWNDPTYVNEWFEVGPYDMDEIDIEGEVESQLEQQDEDCNETENRTDLRIISYEYEFVSQ
jgi:hypothetical protein